MTSNSIESYTDSVTDISTSDFRGVAEAKHLYKKSAYNIEYSTSNTVHTGNIITMILRPSQPVQAYSDSDLAHQQRAPNGRLKLRVAREPDLAVVAPRVAEIPRMLEGQRIGLEP